MALTGTGVVKLVTGSVAGAGVLTLALPSEIPAVADKFPSLETTLGIVFMALAGFIIAKAAEASKKKEPAMTETNSNPNMVASHPPYMNGNGEEHPLSNQLLFRELDKIAKGIERNESSIGQLSGEFKEFRGAVRERLQQLEEDKDSAEERITALERKGKNTGEIARP